MFQRETGEPVTVTHEFSVTNPGTDYTLVILNGRLEDGEFERVSGSIIRLNGIQLVGPEEFNQNVQRIEKPISPQLVNELTVEVRGKPGGALVIEIIGRDDVPPSIIGTVQPAPNADGWNNTDVTVSFECHDTTSGIASCSEPIKVTVEGANQPVVGAATDRAGNTSSTTVVVNLDKTSPSFADFQPPACPATVMDLRPIVAACFTDVLSGVQRATVMLSVDGTDRTAESAIAGSCISWTPPADLSVGQHQGMVTARDAAGNLGSATWCFETQPPLEISITSPVDGFLTNRSSIEVTGTVEPPAALVDVNGVPGIVTGGTWIASGVPLVEGENLLVATARDALGNSVQAQVVGSLDTIPPAVRFLSPASLAAFRSTPVQVEIEVGGVDVASFSFLGQPAALTGGRFTTTAALKEGINVLTAAATDVAGNTDSESLAVTLDTVPPVVLIDSPRNDAVTEAESVTVTGMINDIVVGTVNAADATVTVNGEPAEVLNRRFVLRALPLADGENVIEAVGTDRAGNVGQPMSVRVVRQRIQGIDLRIISGNNQSAPIATALSDPLVVQVVDGQENPVTNRVVTFSVSAGDGLISEVGSTPGARTVDLRTDSSGQARVAFALGSRTGMGSHRVEAKTLGAITSTEFCASALPGPTFRIAIASGNQQTGMVDTELPEPLEVFVVDEGGNPVQDVPVACTVMAGGGSLGGQPSVTVLTDDDGRAFASYTLGPFAGQENNIVQAAFPGLTEAPVEFLASAVEPGPPGQTTVIGVVLDGSNIPIPGVTASIRDSGLSATTDTNGFFEIPGVPEGTQHLDIDGSTAAVLGKTYPELSFVLNVISGNRNSLPNSIHLPELDLAGAKLVGGDQDVILEMDGVPGFQINVFAHSVTFPDGSRTGFMSSTQVHNDAVPMPPPLGSAPLLVGTIQPAGVRFDPPAQVIYPNYEGLAPGDKVDIMSFHHDVGRFVTVGPGTVSEDGALVISDPGVGIVQSGWHCTIRMPGPTGQCRSCGTDTANPCRTAFENPDDNECNFQFCDNTSHTCKQIAVNEGISCGFQPNLQCRQRVCRTGSCKLDNAPSGTICPLPISSKPNVDEECVLPLCDASGACDWRLLSGNFGTCPPVLPPNDQCAVAECRNGFCIPIPINEAGFCSIFDPKNPVEPIPGCCRNGTCEPKPCT